MGFTRTPSTLYPGYLLHESLLSQNGPMQYFPYKLVQEKNQALNFMLFRHLQ